MVRHRSRVHHYKGPDSFCQISLEDRLKYNVSGIHHITACAGGAQQDIDFFTEILGLRMVKQTVLMDGSIPIYHLYYANAKAEPGSVMTTFPYGRKTGRPGSGQISATAYSAPKGSLPFWKEHFDQHKIRMAEFRSASGKSSFASS